MSADDGARGKTMFRRLGISTAVVRVTSITAVLAALAACSDQSTLITGTGVPSTPPSVFPAGLGIVEGSVDSAGNVTLTPLQSTESAGNLAPGIDGNIYAGQNVNVRVYAKPALTTTAGGTKTWKMEYGVQNYLPYPIGSSQGGAHPTDTTGIYLVFVGGPTVTATSGSCFGGCAMNISKFNGTGAFTAPNQKYLYWRERLGAKGSLTSPDTVSRRDSVFFTSPTQVTNFKFYMMVGADWPAPHQTRWSVFYNAPTDSMPDVSAKPIWHLGSETSPLVGNGTEAWSGVDSISLSNTEDYYLYRRDSLAASTPAYMSAQVRVNGSRRRQSAQPQPETIFGLLDGVSFAGVGLTSTHVGFVTMQPVTHTLFFFLKYTVLEARFIGGSAECAVDGTKTHEYLLQKLGTDSAILTVDGSPCASIAYSHLPTVASGNVPTFTTGPAEVFGQGSSSGDGTSVWTTVTYGIGASQP